MERILGLLMLACVALPPVHAAVDASGARSAVEKLHGTLLETMQNGESLGFQGRVAKISPVLSEIFDFQRIAKLVAGRFWAKMKPDQREAFVDVFARLSAATYADNFKEFSGERFEFRGAQEKKAGQLVQTVLITGKGKEVSLDYLVSDDQDLWRIVNVVAQGVSDVFLKRAEYTAVMEVEGIDALIAKLNAKVASYASANS